MCSLIGAWMHSLNFTVFHSFTGILIFLGFRHYPPKCSQRLASSDSGFTINDSIMKIRLIFFYHPILTLRTLSIPNFKYSDIKLDILICLLTSAWDIMVAEHLVQPALSSQHFTTPSASKFSRSFLSDSKREALKLAGGCFRCHNPRQGITKGRQRKQDRALLG